MKVLQVNKYFYLHGGAERYLFDVSEVLERHGHSIVPFAMNDKKNDPTPWAKYFSPHEETSRVKFSLSGLRTAIDTIYNLRAKKKMAALLAVAEPQVAHVHSVYHQLSSSVLDALRDADVPAVMTIHDYRLLSPNYTLYHDGMICERGMKNAFDVVPHKCLKDSYLASGVAAIETALTRHRHTYEKTFSRFLIPSRASFNLFERAGWDMKKFVLVPHFLDTRHYQPQFEAGSDVVYVGRLSPEKGVHVYIEAARMLPDVRFRIIGSGPEETRLRAQAEGLKNVEFVGKLLGAELHRAISSAALVVVPSVWYEVFGYAALEAMALGKPVIASRIGALPELVRSGVNGKLFAAGNSGELANTIYETISNPAEMEKMGRAGRAIVEKEYTPDVHFGRLVEAYSDAMSAPRH